MTKHSAAADLTARIPAVIEPGQRAKIPTGVWITELDWDKVPSGSVPELQIRARSGLSFKKGLMLTNGIGTVDADFRDEICVLMLNQSNETQRIETGDRIAQITLNLVQRIADFKIGDERHGGFGSTGG